MAGASDDFPLQPVERRDRTLPHPIPDHALHPIRIRLDAPDVRGTCDHDPNIVGHGHPADHGARRARDIAPPLPDRA